MRLSKKLLVIALWAGCSTPAVHTSASASANRDEVRLPSGRVEQAQLSTDQHRHVELFRIRRDHGHPNLAIVLDSWVPTTSTAEIASVRMWWVSQKVGQRRPFDDKARKHLDVTYARSSPSAWTVNIAAGSKSFSFDVRLDAKGRPRAYADIVDGSTGAKIESCEVVSGRLNTRKIFGAPVGLKSLVLSCKDAEGNMHEGEVKPR